MKMCPHCGWLFDETNSLVPPHWYDFKDCAGNEQAPRNPESDRRPLWSGEPNPHLSQENPCRDT